MRNRKRSLTRVISLVLILTLMLGVLTIGASAANRDNVKQYKVYACLGDSIAAGYGPYAKNTTNWFMTAPVPEAYHSLVAEATGAYLLRLGWSGTRTEEMRALLDPEFEGDEWCFQQNGMSWFRNYVDEANYVYPGWFDDYYVNSVKMADLATLNVGSNDVMTFSFVNVQNALFNAGASNPVLERIAKLVEQNDQNAALKLIFQTAQTLNMVSEVVKTLTESMIHGYYRFFQNWRPLIDKIYELNPNITLVVVGLYNPFDNVQMTDQSLIKIGKLGTVLIAGMNAEMKNYAAIKGYKFADVMGTPLCETVPLTDPSFLGRILTDVHPSVEGHVYMTEKILEQLPEREVEPEVTTEPTTEPSDPTVVPSDPTVVPTEPAEDPTAVPTLPSTVPTEIPAEPDEPTVPVEPTTGDPTQADPTKVDPTQADPTKVDPTQADPTKVDPTKADPTQAYPTKTEPKKEFPFTDVKKGDWSYDDIYYVWEHGLMNGMGGTIFAPQGTTTRAQFATVIYRMEGSPKVTEAQKKACPFTDLVDEWYQDAVVWAYDAKVVKGVSDTEFAPNAEITREQMVTMLYRYDGEKAAGGDLSKITDADAISEYAKPAVAWAVANGVVNGFPDGTFQPQGNATREQMAAIMARFDRMEK